MRLIGGCGCAGSDKVLTLKHQMGGDCGCGNERMQSGGRRKKVTKTKKGSKRVGSRKVRKGSRKSRK